MKRPLLPAALLAVLLLAACSGNTTQSVSLEGSTSMEKVATVLQEAFRNAYPEAKINLSGTGSGAGIEAVLSGVCDIGLSSRALSREEEARGAAAHLVALDGVALVVHPSNPVRDLSTEQIAAIFTGQVTNWRQLDGPDAPIAAYGREAGSGSRGAFESLLAVEDVCRYTNEYGSTGDIIGNVAANPNAIGYVSLASVNSTVAAIRVGGAACTVENIRTGAYPLQRPFLMVTREGAALSEAAQAFLDFSLSGEASAYLSLAGAIAP